ncbi:MAG: sortase [Anaerolineaceae bacterium]|nr:sortase [Anaerolineaceae bacterium]
MRRIINLFIIVSISLGLFNITPSNVVFAQTPTEDISATISFNPSKISLQGQTRMTITISNGNETLDLTDAVLNTVFDAELYITNPDNNLVEDCSDYGGSVSAAPGATNVTFSGVTIPVNSSCTIVVNVSANDDGNRDISIPVDGIQGNFDGELYGNQDAVSETLNVAAFDFNAEINKSFDEVTLVPGEVTRMNVSIYNPNGFELTDVSWTDTMPEDLDIADPPGVGISVCGPGAEVTAVAGESTLSLSNATVPEDPGGSPGVCTVSVNVTSTAGGENQINTIDGEILVATGNGGSVSNTDPASATLTVLEISAPSVTKSYSPTTIWVNQSSQLTIRITNEDTVYPISELTLTDDLSEGSTTPVVLANPVSSSMTNCGSSPSLDAVNGNDYLTISGAEIAPEETCIIRVNVTSAEQGEFVNDIAIGDIGTKQGVTNDALASAQLNVQMVRITKELSPSPINAGDLSTLTITLENPTGTDFTSVALDDVLPGNDLYFTDSGETPDANDPATDCGEGILTISTDTTDTTPVNNKLSLTGGTIPAGTVNTPGSCTITAIVTTSSVAPDSNSTNTIQSGALSALSGTDPVTNLYPASDSIGVRALSIDLHKSYSPSSIQEGRTTTLTIRLSNPTDEIVHVTDLTDTLPSGVVPIGPVSTTCTNGEATFSDNSPADSTLTLSAENPPNTGAEIPAGSLASPGTCTVSVVVSIASAGSYPNTIPANTLVTGEGLTNLDSASRTITVYPTDQGLTGSKNISAATLMAGDPTQMTITLSAPADEAITDLGFEDNLPANMYVVNTGGYTTSNSCGGTLTAIDGSNTITLIAADDDSTSISAGSSCTVRVYVSSDVSGSYTNTIPTGNITNDQLQTTQNDLSDSLIVTHLDMSKAFYPNIVAPGGRSTLRITLENQSTVALLDTTITQDNLNTMGGSDFTVANPANAQTTCVGGIVGATPGTQIITLDDAVVPAQVGEVPGTCTIQVDIIASETITPLPTTRTNTVYRSNVSGTLSGLGTIIRPVANRSASLQVTPLQIGVVKKFDPLTVFGGSLSTMSITLINPNNVVLTDMGFTDNLPEGMFIGNPVNANTGTCGGTIFAVPEADSFFFSGGTLAANKQCTLTLNATMNVHGNRTNTIPVGGVTTFNGGENTQAASASLTNLPGASITKYFTPDEIILGETANLTIRITNTGNVPLTKVGLTDTLPTNVTVAAAAVTDECNGDLTADIGSGTIEYENGSIAAGPGTTCDIVVPVEASESGAYTNTIPKNNLSTDEGATNKEPAEDKLTVKASPNMQLTKTLNTALSGIAPYELGETLHYDLVLMNMGDIDITNVNLSDPNTIMGTCEELEPTSQTVTFPATLEVGDTINCQVTHVIVQDDVDNSPYVNVATATSDETDPVTDSVTVPIDTTDVMTLEKAISVSGPYEIGDSLDYQISVDNIGSSVLNNVTLSDPDLLFNTCFEMLPSSQTVVLPGILEVGDSIICSASHVVVQADVDAGSFTNTVTADSDETDPLTDSVTVQIEDNASLEVYKQVTSTGPHNVVGALIEYDISAVNTGDATLTNVTITDPGTDVNLGTCTPAQPTTLATDEILSCEATHTVTADDITAGGFSNTAYADSDQTDPVSDTAEVVTQTPTISLVKSGSITDTDGSGNHSVDDVVNYTFTITNTGEVTLNDIQIIDIVGGVTISGGPITTLDPGGTDSTTISGTYELTQSDIDSGSFTNTASVTGEPTVGSTVSDTDNDTQSLTADPEITLTKTGTLNENIVAPNDEANVGDTITYAFTVENTGNVTLTNVSISDPDASLSCDPASWSLAPGESRSHCTGTYTLTQTDINAGTYTNAATATGSSPGNTDDVTDDDDDTQTLTPEPGITLTKTGTQQQGTNSRIDAGETITYAFSVTNTGNVTLTNISITDPDTTISGTIASLAPGATNNSSITGSHIVTQTEINNRSYSNTATVTGTLPQGGTTTNTGSDTQDLVPVPSIRIVKTGTLDQGTNSRADAGDEIDYTFAVRNDGNVTLTNVAITDPDVAVTCDPAIPTLAPGDEHNSCTGTYTLSQGDVDAHSFENTATVTGSSPGNTDDVSDIDSDTQSLIPDASINLEKTGNVILSVVDPPGQADPGDQIEYEFTITNIGNVTLTDVTIVDNSTGVVLSGDVILSMAPGDSVSTDENDATTYKAVYTLTQDDIDAATFTNTARVVADSPDGSEDVEDTDSDTRDLTDNPRIGVAKRVVGNPVKVSPGTWDVTFEILVKNYGNVTLTNILVSDDLDAAFLSDPVTVRSLTSLDLSVNSSYDGITDTELLDGTDELVFDEEGVITLVIRLIPSSGGPFNNTAVASGQPPTGDSVTDDSQTGVDPDPDNNLDPTDNDETTLTDFGPNLFDPPFGVKLLNEPGMPLLEWTMVWINDSNIVALDAAVADGIPLGTTFYDDGVSSGYALPAGTLPAGTTNTGVTCTAPGSVSTTTTYCYYEGSTVEYPRGRIVWEGELGADLGATNASNAVNELYITFAVEVNEGVGSVENNAVLSADLNGDGDLDDSGEVVAAEASQFWAAPDDLPLTGFSRFTTTDLPMQPAANTYAQMGGMQLSIPELDVLTDIVSVPFVSDTWDVTWLGDEAGHLEGSAYPTWAGNTVITAHNWSASNEPGIFSRIKRLKYGDQVQILAHGKVYTYEVRENKLVRPKDDEVVFQHEEYDWLTLLTCEFYNPFNGKYLSRRMVRAVLVEVK